METTKLIATDKLNLYFNNDLNSDYLIPLPSIFPSSPQGLHIHTDYYFDLLALHHITDLRNRLDFNYLQYFHYFIKLLLHLLHKLSPDVRFDIFNFIIILIE